MAEESAWSRFRGWLDTTAGRTTAGLLAVLMIVAAVTIFVTGKGKEEKLKDYYEDQGQKLWVICTECSHTEQVRVPLTQTFPMECANCNEVKAMEGFRCTTCRKVFVMPKELRFRCPYCNAYYDYSLAGGRGGR
jgi:hypothetical protein